MKTKYLANFALGLTLATTAIGSGFTNSWVDGNGKWENSNNWSRTVAPSSFDPADTITNAGNNTVTIDATTTNTSSAMTISNLLVSANTLSILNVGTNVPLHILNAATLSSGGSLLITNSTLIIDGVIGAAALEIGGTNLASMTVLAGSVVTVSPLSVGMGAMPGAGGTLTLAGGTFTVGNVLTFGGLATTATVWVTGGNLIAGGVYVGGGTLANADRLVLSNGTIRTGDLIIGQGFNAVGTMTMAGGTTYVGHLLLLGATVNGGTGFLTLDGGSLFVTNNSTAVLTVDQGTLTLSNGATLVTDSLITTSPTASFINLGGTFLVTSPAQVEQGTMSVSGGTNQVGSTLTVAVAANSTGTVNVTGGQLVATNGVIGVGNDGTATNGFGVGTMTVSNGTVLGSSIVLGSTVGGQGQLTVQTNGLVSLVGTDATLVANDVTIDGGDVEIVNGQIDCGRSHPGAMTMSNGTANSQITYVGYDSQGTLTMLAGQMTVSSLLDIGFMSGSTGAVWMSGGQLTATALPTIIGDQGVGQMSISNGIVTMANVVVGNSGNPGTLILAGGTLTVNSLVLLNPTSQFLFSGGWFNAWGITNSTGQTLTLGNGISPITLNLLGGISSLGNGLKISPDATITGFGTITGSILNSGLIVSSGGTLTFTGIVTNNGVMRATGGSVLNFGGPVVNNGAIDVLNGGANFNTPPTGSGYVITTNCIPTITAIQKVGADIHVSFTTCSNAPYAVDYETNLVTGSWTTLMNPTGTSSIVTITDPGAALQPKRFYRVNLVVPP